MRFVSRGVNHVLSLRTSVARDPGDGTTSPPAERVGGAATAATKLGGSSSVSTKSSA